MTGSGAAQIPLDAMLTEAGRWREAARRMFDVSTVVRGLTLSEADVSGGAVNSGLVDTYLELQSSLYKLISQGGDQFLDTADRLEKIVRRSQLTEQENAERLARVKHALEEQGYE